MFWVFTPCMLIIDVLEGPGTPIFGVEAQRFNLRVRNNTWNYMVSHTREAKRNASQP